MMTNSFFFLFRCMLVMCAVSLFSAGCEESSTTSRGGGADPSSLETGKVIGDEKESDPGATPPAEGTNVPDPAEIVPNVPDPAEVVPHVPDPAEIE